MHDDETPADSEERKPADEAGRAEVRPRAPSVPPPPGGLVPAARVLFAAAWLVLQSALILTADRRPDGAFGFRMFNESSTIKLALYREVLDDKGQRARLRVDDGAWSARDARGTLRRFTWYERVRAPFWPFDREIHASYGAAAQLARLQAAVDDVAAHIPEDAETRRLLLDVTVKRNGREPQVHHLTSRERSVAPARSPSDGGGG